MTLIVCIDDRKGQAFHQRRLSRDRALCARVIAQAEGRTLRMSPYSEPLFSGVPVGTEHSARILVGEDYLGQAEEDDLCFVELEDVASCREKASKVILYRWNRAYPSDLKFSLDLQDGAWGLVSSTDFPGYSHEKITEEVYEKM